MSQPSTLEDDFSVCGHCGHPDCRDCFPWPDTDTAEVRELREKLAESQASTRFAEEMIEDMRGQLHRVQMDGILAKHDPEIPRLRMALDAANKKISDQLRVIESDKEKIQGLTDTVTSQSERIMELEAEVVRLKEYEWMYQGLQK